MFFFRTSGQSQEKSQPTSLRSSAAEGVVLTILAVRREIRIRVGLIPVRQCVRVCLSQQSTTQSVNKRVISKSEDSIVKVKPEYICCIIYLCSIYYHLHRQNHTRTERPAVAPGTHILVQPLSCDERPLPYLPFKMLMISAADAPPSLRMLNISGPESV